MRDSAAEYALVATCAHLSLSFTREHEDFSCWRRELRDLVSATARCGTELAEVRYAAEQIVKASGSQEIGNAMTQLRFTMRSYYRLVAAKRIEAWKTRGAA